MGRVRTVILSDTVRRAASSADRMPGLSSPATNRSTSAAASSAGDWKNVEAWIRYGNIVTANASSCDHLLPPYVLLSRGSSTQHTLVGSCKRCLICYLPYLSL